MQDQQNAIEPMPSTSGKSDKVDGCDGDLKTYPWTKAIGADLDNRFMYHSPKPDQLPRYALLRSVARDLAREIIAHTPPSREQSLALTHLEESIFFANAAIARNEK
jgi:hypothetical protein